MLSLKQPFLAVTGEEKISQELFPLFSDKKNYHDGTDGSDDVQIFERLYLVLLRNISKHFRPTAGEIQTQKLNDFAQCC